MVRALHIFGSLATADLRDPSGPHPSRIRS
jgi:hypothetical protein